MAFQILVGASAIFIAIGLFVVAWDILFGTDRSLQMKVGAVFITGYSILLILWLCIAWSYMP